MRDKTNHLDHDEIRRQDLINYGQHLTRIMDRYLWGFECENEDFEISQEELLDSIYDIKEINNLMKCLLIKLKDTDQPDQNMRYIKGIMDDENH